MNVITKYPIVVSGSDAQTESDYRRTYAGFNGLEVKTKYPIVTSTSDAETESDYMRTYSAASGSVRRARRASRRRKGQGFGQRLKKGASSLLNNPFVQNVLGQKLGLGNQGGGSPTSSDSYTPEPEKRGLSTGAKIGIGVGIVAVIGVAAYFLTKKK